MWELILVAINIMTQVLLTECNLYYTLNISLSILSFHGGW